MKSLINYTEAVSAIRDAILRSQYRALSTVSKDNENESVVIRSPAATELQVDENMLLSTIRQPMVVQFTVRDYTKPMGVATYRTAEEMPENWRKALPNIDEMKKLL